MAMFAAAFLAAGGWAGLLLIGGATIYDEGVGPASECNSFIIDDL